MKYKEELHYFANKVRGEVTTRDEWDRLIKLLRFLDQKENSNVDSEGGEL